jgi:hypothetical protein
MKASSAKSVRCAIYTRISADQGLDQDFNSLDARYEAASAYIKNQAHAGWILIRSRYNAVRARRGALVRRRFLHIKGELVLREGAPQATTAAEQYFCSRWTGRAGRAPCHGNCEHPQALLACSMVKAGSPRRAAFCNRYTIASVRVLKLPT